MRNPMAFDVHAYVLDVVKGVRAKVVDGIATAEENKAEAERTIASCKEQLAALDAWISIHTAYAGVVDEGRAYLERAEVPGKAASE